jgi:ribosomal protein S27E
MTFDCPNCHQPQQVDPDHPARVSCADCGAVLHLIPNGDARVLFIPERASEA